MYHCLRSRSFVAIRSLRAVDCDGGGAGREVTLGGNDLVVVVAKGHALAGPGVEVSLHVDRSAGALVLTNRPVLLKGPSSINRWLVGTGRLSDLVRRAVDGHGALVLGLGARVVRAFRSQYLSHMQLVQGDCSPEVLNDVVLDEGVASPTVDGQVGVAVGVV
jgi:hypothetical protein